MNEKDLEILTKSLILPMEKAGELSIDTYEKGLKIQIKDDNSPVTNGDIEVNKILTKAIKEHTPSIPIISEETVDLKVKNTNKVFWLIDPIDGTKEYIKGSDEYTLNIALIINGVPAIGLVGVPRKGRLFYAHGKENSFLLEKGKIKRLSSKKNSSRNEIVALSSTETPSQMIKEKLNNYKVKSIVKMASSYKFCVIANGEFDIYAARERANEWDYAAGHAIASKSGSLITTLEGEPFLYGKEDYKNPSILILRSKNLNA